MSDKELQELLTRKEVEKVLKVSRSQIYNLLRSGKLVAYKIGGNLRFQKNDINNLIKAHPYTQKGILKGKKILPPSKIKKQPLDFKEVFKGQNREDEKGVAGRDLFSEALRFSESLDFHIDSQEKKYKLGQFLVLDFKDFENENPYITTTKIKGYFRKALLDKFSLNLEEIEDILQQMEPKLKELGRKIFIRNMQQQGNLYSG